MYFVNNAEDHCLQNSKTVDGCWVCFVVFLFLNQFSTFKQTTQVDQSVLQNTKKKCSLGAEYVPSLHHDT